MDEIKLSESEQVAKAFVINLIGECTRQCDATFRGEDFKLPEWFDAALFKRGQKYFRDNRAGMMLSKLYGLMSLICDPESAKFLDRTGKSSTPNTAKKRYVATLRHILFWYEEELKPGSKSWESLKLVRKLHLSASNASNSKNLWFIDNFSMTVTVFGFMGYALVRPHLLGIRHDNLEDRKAFVHFWAVVGSMLGIEDSNNMCLHSIEVVETICRIFIRYLFVPLLQLDSPIFEKLGEAFVFGLRSYLPFSTFKSRLFLARRLAGVPGYQYNVDMAKEFFIHQIFNSAELKLIDEVVELTPGHSYRRKFVFHEEILLLDVQSDTNFKDKGDVNENHLFKALEDVFELPCTSQLIVTKVDENNIKSYFNDRCFHKLGKGDQVIVKLEAVLMKMSRIAFVRSFAGAMTNIVMKKAKRQESA